MGKADEAPLRDEEESTQDEEEKEYWPFWKLCIIALPQLGVQVLWVFLGPNTTPYLRSLGASESFAEANNMAGPIVGFFVGPLVGTWSDQSTSKWGRRRPVIVAGLISTIVAGLLYSGSRTLLGKSTAAVYLSASMQWLLDFTINAMQTPFRALVSDLASDEQQLPMQIWFSAVCSAGGFLAFSLGKVYQVPVHHMLELMCMVLALNVLCVGLSFSLAREKQYKRSGSGESGGGLCAEISGMGAALAGRPKSFYLLLGVNCVIWLGNTVWGVYGKVWFTDSVFEGDNDAAEGSAAYEAYADGNRAFATAGQIGQILSLVLSLAFMGFGMIPKCPDHLLFAPCIFSGALVLFISAFFVGHAGNFAMAMFILSNIQLTASGSFPYGFVAVWNKAAEEAGEVGSVAMQMAILNCCITVGQQACTMILTGLGSGMDHVSALHYLFIIAAVAGALGGVGSLFLNVGKPAEALTSDSDEDSS